MNQQSEDEFRAFVTARMDRWRSTAYLFCRDWHTADDLVSTTVAKIYQHWRRVSAADNPDAYATRVLTHAWVDETKRPWRRREQLFDFQVEPPPVQAGQDLDEREALWRLLGSLGRGQRAVLVLRFYLDLSVQETAEALGITEGTVKSQSARGLAALRALATTMRTEAA